MLQQSQLMNQAAVSQFNQQISPTNPLSQPVMMQNNPRGVFMNAQV